MNPGTTLQILINIGFLVAIVLTVFSGVMHALGLDQKPWAKPLLRASNDVVGMIKAFLALRAGGSGNDSDEGGGDASGGNVGGPRRPGGPGQLPPPRGRSAARVGLMVAFPIVFVLSGCIRDTASAIDQVSRRLTEVPILVEVVRAAEEAFFLAHPDPVAKAKIEHLLANTALLADGALRATEGASDLAKGEAAASIDKLRQAWTELQAVLRDAHIVGADGKFAAELGGGAVRVPEPLLFGPAR